MYQQSNTVSVSRAGIWQVVCMEPETIDLFCDDLWTGLVRIVLHLCLLSQQSHSGCMHTCSVPQDTTDNA